MRRWVWILLIVGCASHRLDAPQSSRILERPLLASGQRLLEYDGYSAVFDSSRHIPLWVGYILRPQDLQGGVPRYRGRFSVDAKVPGCPTHDAYRAFEGKYERGHLAPSADFRRSAALQKDTFLMTNVAPQLGCFNRGIWLALEDAVREWTRNSEEVFVTTGPLASDQCSKEDGAICIPRAFFKAVLKQGPQGKQAIGFLFPHRCDPERGIAAFSMSVDELERHTGLDFFAALEDTEESRLEAHVEGDWFTASIAQKARPRRR
ncbi:DNA/RNA non-specific endonuclease [bacterium]|nr:DNA/RNA non-specific endonuclease [bacterium]